MARSYRSRRKPSTRSIAAIIGGSAGAAIALALAWRLLGDLGDLAFVGMAARGLVIGVLLAWLCKCTAFSRPRAAASIAGIATLLSILGSHTLAYERERNEQERSAVELHQLRAGFGHDAASLDADFDHHMASVTWGRYWQRYFGLQGSGVDGASNFMGPAFGIGLFSLELVVAILVAMYLPSGRASEPACEECGAWLAEERPLRTKFGNTGAFVRELQRTEDGQAFSNLGAPDTPEFLELSLALCPLGHDSSAGVLRLREHFFSRRGRRPLLRHRADLRLGPEERSSFEAAKARLA